MFGTEYTGRVPSTSPRQGRLRTGKYLLIPNNSVRIFNKSHIKSYVTLHN